MDEAVRNWLARLLVEAEFWNFAEGERQRSARNLAHALVPRIEDALRASARDMLRQCSVAQFGSTDDPEAIKEWEVSVNEAVAAAIRRLEHRRQDA